MYLFINSFFGASIANNKRIRQNIRIIVIIKLISSFLITSIIAILLMFLIFYFSYLNLLLLLFSVFIFYLINKRLFYLFYYENGLAFTVKSCFIYYIENLISQIAIMFYFIKKLVLSVGNIKK